MRTGQRLAAALIAAIFFSAGAADASLRVEIVHENPAFELIAIDHAGVAYGQSRSTSDPTRNYRLYRSTDEGRTWTRLYDFPSSQNLRYISVLTNDTLIAHLGALLYRSGDGGNTWTHVLTMPSGYRTVSPHSITDNGRAVFAGSYNAGLGSSNHTNWVWRSTDDGRTWKSVRTTTNHRHVHFVQANPYTGDIYVGYGDTAAQSEIERTSDDGLTWKSVCRGDPCKAVSIAFDPAGFAVFGQDHIFRDGYIVRLDLASGVVTRIARLPGPSYSALRLRDGVWLVGEAHEPKGTTFSPGDKDVHLFGSDDDAGTFADVFHRPYLNPDAYVRMDVYFAFPNGDFSIEVGGYGTIVARAVSENAGPSLSVSRTALAFEASEGVAPVDQALQVSTSDASATAYSATEVAPWLTVTPASGETPDSLDVGVDASGLAPGTYTSAVRLDAVGYESASFSVQLTVAGAGPPNRLMVSTSSNRSGAQALPGAVVSGQIYAFEAIPAAGVARVNFYLDNPGATGTPRRVENTAPYDFNGGSASTANAFDTRTLLNGSHTITAVVIRADGTSQTERATFTVAN